MPPAVTITRDSDTLDDLWRAIHRNIAPGRTLATGNDIIVPIEDFLSQRNWLGNTLSTFGCDVSLSPAVIDLIEREDAENDEVSALLANPVLHRGEFPAPVTSSESRFRAQKLRQFQIRDLAHILSLSHGANFSVPGAGKTAVAYACYENERLKGRVQRLLVVAPLSAFDSWTTEALKWMNPAPVVTWFDQRIPASCEVLLINYQKLVSRYKQIAAWVYARPCHVILDEAHRIKQGRKGEWGSACLDIAYLAARRDILTGTPAPQHPTDFIALMDFLWPHQASRILPTTAMQPNPPPQVMREVSRRLQPLFSRTKKDELGLSPPRLKVELVSMKPLQAEIYTAVRSRMQQQIAMSLRDRVLVSQMTDVVMYLIEAATNPALLARALGGEPQSAIWPPMPLPASSSLVEKILRYPSYEMPRKFEKLATMVASNAQKGRKTLVWSNFVANLEELAHRVLAPYNPALIYGAIPSSPRETTFITRQSELARFRSDPSCMVLLANPAAMSEGVSLHEDCHDAIYLERTFNAGQYLQSVDRIHRLGLPPGIDTHITFLVSTGTIDQTIDTRVALKAKRLSQMLSDPNLTVMALPDPDDYGEWVETNDLDSILSHLSSAP